jgi:hypothetical protein
MLSAKLSETLNEEEEDLDENYYEEKDTMDEGDDMEETMDEGDDMEETMDEGEDMEETMDETYDEGENLDEEIDLEEILNELELEEAKSEDKDKVDEAKDDDLDEAKDMDEKSMDEAKDDDLDEAKKDDKKELDEMEVTYKAETANRAGYAADYVNEGETFDLDSLLEEINNLDEEKEDEVNEYVEPTPRRDTSTSDRMKATLPGGKDAVGSFDAWMKAQNGYVPNDAWQDVARKKFNEGMYETIQAELAETQAALEVKTTELNEVNLLNSKLLYVNRIFKANTLDEGQKLRVVETLDKAETSKEAKLIYETIKDTFNVAKSKKASFKSKTKSLKEGIGMASKTVGTTAPKKEIISESNNMVNRFQKLANIKINQ